MIAVPATTPVTVPVVRPIVATPVLLLVHVPLGTELFNWVVAATQTFVEPVIPAGALLTVKSVVT